MWIDVWPNARAVVWLVLFLAVHVAVRHLLLAVPRRSAYSSLYAIKMRFRNRRYPPLLLKLLRIGEGERMRERRRQLAACNLPVGAVAYELARRLAMALFTGLGAAAALAFQHIVALPGFRPGYAAAVAMAGWAVLLSERTLLDQLKKRRARAIVTEVYTVSKHLLYYADSAMNLHGKLVRCIPHTRKIRGMLYQLTNEWYQDAEAALDRFKARLGTEEGHGFAETLKSLHRHDSELYYDLLRRRNEDYKEKIELASEERKELTSYLLFVLAGIPILYTFRIFISPWVAEGRKLFDLLG